MVIAPLFFLQLLKCYLSIQPAIHSIYGFVRFADEVVDTFHDKDKKLLLDKFEWDFYQSLEMGISLNPILHSFQKTIKILLISNWLMPS